VRRYRTIEQQQDLDPTTAMLAGTGPDFPPSRPPLDLASNINAEAVLALRRSSDDLPHMTRAGDDGTKPLIIVGMSANSDSESKRLAKEAGMDYFLEKPFTIADFNLVLQRIYMKENEGDYDEDFSPPSSPAFTVLSEF
jgi:hypothetical protein